MSGRKATLRPDPLHSRLAHCKNRQPRPLAVADCLHAASSVPAHAVTLGPGAQHAVEARRLGARAPGPPRRQDGALRAGRILAGPDHRQRRAGRAVRSGRGAGCDADRLTRKTAAAAPVRRSGAGHGRGHAYFRRRGAGPGGGRPVQAVALGSRRRAGARGGRHRRAAPGGRGAQAGGRLAAGRPARGRECPNTWPRKRPAAGPSGAGAMAPGPGRAGRARRGAGAVRRRSADETGRRWHKRGA